MAIKTYYLLKRFIDTSEKNLPFYIENLESSVKTLTLNTTYSDATNIEYSTDNVTWSSTKPNIPANGRVYVRANATYWSDGQFSIPNAKIYTSGQYNVGGNIMSMLYGSSFTGTEITFPDSTKTNIFAGFFTKSFGMGDLVSAEKLALPATTLADGCYNSMFQNCTSLTAAPALPATTLVQSCYVSMFVGCTSLTAAPALPATTLVSSCYQYMFYGCTSLTAAPALLATTLANNCYYQMFQNCSNLSSITVGATSWTASSASNWVNGVSTTGTFTKPTNTTIPTGTNGIPSGWTVVNV